MGNNKVLGVDYENQEPYIIIDLRRTLVNGSGFHLQPATDNPQLTSASSLRIIQFQNSRFVLEIPIEQEDDESICRVEGCTQQEQLGITADRSTYY